MTKCARYCFLIVLSLLVAGCGSATAVNPTQDTFHASSTATAAIAGTPQVSDETGAVTATLRYAAEGVPSRQQIFYAAPLEPVVGGDGTHVALVAALDATTAQRGESNTDGRVVISGIPPGQYGLAMATPRGYILLTESPGGTDIVFDVVAGQVTDLGTKDILVEKDLVEP